MEPDRAPASFMLRLFEMGKWEIFKFFFIVLSVADREIVLVRRRFLPAWLLDGVTATSKYKPVWLLAGSV